jgi:acetyltransferase-like isoleucine patch superfamily enzyme
MKLFVSILLALLPSFIHTNIRRLKGQKIGKGAKLRFGTIIISSNVHIGSNTIVGPFTYINTPRISIGENSRIKSFTFIKTLEVKIDNYVHIAPFSMITSEFTENAGIRIGDHSRIFPHCWLDAGEGITIGKHVGVGGHTLMFTHGVWSNFIEGGPVTFGPIVIEDNVWLPWRVFILPDVVIGENSIIGANSLINKSIPANMLAAGSPAKPIKELDIKDDERKKRLNLILEKYASYLKFKYNTNTDFSENMLRADDTTIIIDEAKDLSKGDLLILLDKPAQETELSGEKQYAVLDYKSMTIYLNGNKNVQIKNFISFLRRYGVRLYVKG